MNFLKSIALSVSALALFADAAPTGQTFDTPYATPSAINCTSDASCALLKHVSVQTVTYSGLIGGASYTWQGTCGGKPDKASYVRPTGARLGCFKLHGFTSLKPGIARLTPAQFGAKCDGKTNDTTALQALAAAAGRTYLQYYNSHGLCYTDQITISANGSRFLFAPGAGFKSIANSTHDQIILLTATANVTFTGPGIFDGNAANNTSHAVKGFSFTGTSTGGFVWDGLTFNDCASDCIALWGAVPQPVFRNLTFNHWGLPTGPNYNAGAIRYIMTTNAADIQGPIMDNIVGTQPSSMAPSDESFITVWEQGTPVSSGYWIYGAQYSNIRYEGPTCTYSGSGGCADVGALRPWYNKYFVVSAVSIRGGGNGFDVSTDQHGQISNMGITGNAGFPIELNGTNDDLNFSNVGINSEGSVALDGNNTNVKFNNLQIVETLIPGGTSGVFATNAGKNASGLEINGCYIKPSASNPGSVSPIWINGPATHDVKISNCVLDGGGVLNIGIRLTNVSKVTIANTRAKGFLDYGVLAQADAGATVPLDKIVLSSPIFDSIGKAPFALGIGAGATAGHNIRTTGCVGCSLLSGITSFDFDDRANNVYHGIGTTASSALPTTGNGSRFTNSTTGTMCTYVAGAWKKPDGTTRCAW